MSNLEARKAAQEDSASPASQGLVAAPDPGLQGDSVPSAQPLSGSSQMYEASLALTSSRSQLEEDKIRGDEVNPAEVKCSAMERRKNVERKSTAEAVGSPDLLGRKEAMEPAEKPSCEDCVWNLLFGAKNVEIWVCELSDRECELKLRTDKKKTLVKMRSTFVITTSQTKLWKGEIPRNVSNPQLYLKADDSIAWDHQKYYKFDIPPRTNYFFIFANVLQRIDEHIRFPSTYRCLRYYSEMLLKEHSYPGFAELIEQFQGIERDESCDVNLLYELCEDYCKGDYKLDIGAVGCLLAVIGVTNTSRACVVDSYWRLLDAINEAFITHLALCEQPNFIMAVKKGLCWCLEWYQCQTNCLRKSTLLLFRSDSQLFNYFLESTLEVKREFLQDWLDILLQVDTAQQLNYIKKLILKTFNLPALFELVTVFSSLFPFNEQNKAIIKARIWAIQYCVMEEEVGKILDLLKRANGNSKEFFYQAGLPERLAASLEVPSGNHLPLYLRLLVYERDERLIGKIQIHQFLLNLVKQKYVYFSCIINGFAPSEEEAKSLFDVWAAYICSYSNYCSEKAQILLKMDKEIIGINNEQMQLIIAKCAVNLAMKILEQRREAPLSAADTINSLTSPLLKNAFLTACTPHMRGLNDAKVEELISRRVEKPTNWFIWELVSITMEDMPLINFEEVEKKLLSPELDSSWVLIIENLHLFSSYKFTESLLQGIERFAGLICRKEMVIEKELLIESKSQASLQQLCSFVKKALSIRNQSLANEFDEILRKSIKTMRQIKAQLDNCTELLNDIFVNLKEQRNLLVELSNFKNSFKQQCLATFAYPADLERLCQAVDIVMYLSYSELYTKYLANSPEPLALCNLERSCLQAKQDLSDFIDSIMQNINKTAASEVFAHFDYLQDWKRELEILKTNKSEWSVEFSLLDNFVIRYNQRESLKTSCDNMLNQQKAFGILESSMQHTIRYLEHYSTLESLTVPKVNELFQGVETELYSEGEFSKSESARQILNGLQQNPDFIPFVNTLIEEQLRFMLECVNDYDESILNAHAVIELTNVWHFWQAVGRQQSYRQFIEQIQKKLKENQFRDIWSSIRACIINLKAFQDLTTNTERKGEAKRVQMEDLYNCSTFEFTRKEEVEVKGSSIGDRTAIFSLANLQELKDRASLTIHAAKTEEGNHSIGILQTFVELVEEVQSILSTLKQLLELGYCDDLVGNMPFGCREGNFEELTLLRTKCEAVLEDWNIAIKETYSNYHFLTYAFGKQFWELETFLRDDEQSTGLGASLLLFMDKQYQQSKNLSGSSTKDRLENLAKVISDLPELNSEFQIEYQVPTNAAIEYYQGRVLYLQVPPDRVLHGLLSLYLHTNRTVPVAAQVLSCTHGTVWPELQAFFYRCFTCRKNKLYTLVCCEQLPIEVQFEVRNLFHEFKEKYFNVEFALAILTSKDDCLLAEYFLQLGSDHCIVVRDMQVIGDEKVMEKVISQIDSKISGSLESSTVVVTSEAAGAGKTTWITQQIHDTGKVSVKFPISGDLELSEMCERMLSQAQGEICLHITLSHVDNLSLLNDLLTYLIIFRTLRVGTTIAVIPANIKIFIEVQNLQPSLTNSLPVLKYLKQHQVRFDLARMILLEGSREELVGQYLYLSQHRLLNEEIRAQGLRVSELIGAYNEFFTQTHIQELSFSSLSIFVTVMAMLIQRFQACQYSSEIISITIGDLSAKNMKFCLNPARIEYLTQVYQGLRQDIFEGLLHTAMEMATKCGTAVRTAQFSALAEVTTEPQTEQIMAWENSNHFCLFFTNDSSIFSVYRTSELVPENFKRVLYLQTHSQEYSNLLIKNILENRVSIEEYSNKTHTELLDILINMYTPRESVGHASLTPLKYVVTPDNFLKMHLISLRADCKLPVIIMGNTGCGKTSLIRYFVTIILREEVDILNVHAGVTSKVLSDMMSKVNAKALEMAPRRYWVFFDEFNTSDCVGEICEILCERSFLGDPIPDNIITVAACNPYRRKLKVSVDDLIGIKKSCKYRQSLIHLVKPLPSSCLEHIWDFGSLIPKDSKTYIKAMIEEECLGDITAWLIEVIYQSQQYFHQKEDASSVSLRDLTRFVILYRWFAETHLIRLSNCPLTRAKQHRLTYTLATYPDNKLFAVVMALSNCYYYRIAKQEERDEYLLLVETASKGIIRPTAVKGMLRSNEDDLLARMELPTGIALNQAFRENVSCIFCCIMTKIPLFICGKPGCSKSLAIQVVLGNLRGERSADPYFSLLPELVQVPFQGSESCTSDGIIKAFERAKKYLNQNPPLLPVVIFDEIGLAEISKHNPLKVLHSLLELENREIGFVGISNWRLDASKMNRAMYLARPDPEIQDLELTAQSIYSATCEREAIRVHQVILSGLAKMYFDYKQHVKQAQTDGSDFYGLRDFYHLIKQVSRELESVECTLSINESIVSLRASIVKRAIERNFGGKRNAASDLCKRFSNDQGLEMLYSSISATSTVDLIKQNLETPDARYVMLICSGDIAMYAVDKYLQHKEKRILVGSRLAEDENNTDYSFKVLSDIILYMEQNISLVLKDMDSIYSSLYDLFNQNFARVGDRKYCRVALGAYFNPRCFVHNNFSVIVLLNEDEVRMEELDAPFLNRFEKHRFNVNEMLSSKQQQAFTVIMKWVDKLTSLYSGKKLEIQLSHIFPLFTEDYLKLMILFQQEQDCESIANKCQTELLRTASEELLLVAHASVLEQEAKDSLYKQWTDLHSDAFLPYLQGFRASGHYSRTVVFTFDSIILHAKDLPDSTVYQHFSTFTCEQDLVGSLIRFYNAAAQDLYILDVNLTKHSQHLSAIKFSLERHCRENSDKSKKVCLLIRMVRNIECNPEVCWFDDWDKRFYSFLKGDPFTLSPDLINMSTSKLIEQGLLYSFEKEISRITFEAYQRIDLQFSKSIPCELLGNYVSLICKGVNESPELMAALKMKILELMEAQTNQYDWVQQVICEQACVKKSSNLLSAIRTAIGTEILKHYTTIIFSLEQVCAFHSYFTASPAQELSRTVWLLQLNTIKCDVTLQDAHFSNKLELRFLLEFPFSYMNFRMIVKLFEDFGHSESDENVKNLLASKYRECTVLHCVLKQISQEPSLVRLYMRDLVRISMEGKANLLPFEQVMWRVYMSLTRDQSALEEKVFAFMENRYFVGSVFEVLSAIQSLCGRTLNTACNQIEELCIRVDSDSVSAHSSTQAYKKHLVTIITEAINDIIVSIETLTLETTKGLKSIVPALHSLGEVYTCLSNTCEVSYDCLDKLQLWGSFIDVLSQCENGEQLLNEFRLKRAKESEENLFTIDFAKDLIELMDRTGLLEATQRFKSTYYYLLLLHDYDCLSMIVKDINSTDTFWRFCGTVIQMIIEEAASELADPYPFFFEDKAKLRNLKTLENELTASELNSKFTVLCADIVAKKFRSKIMEDKAFVLEGKENLKLSLRDPSDFFPTVTKVLSSAYLRVYLEAYCRVRVKDVELSPEEKKAFNSIDKLLWNAPSSSTRRYAFTFIVHYTNWPIDEHIRWFRNSSITWLEHDDFEGVKTTESADESEKSFSSLERLPYLRLLVVSAEALKIFDDTIKIITVKLSETKLKTIATSVSRAEHRAAFSMAILYAATVTGVSRDVLKKVLTSLDHWLENRLGTALHRLVEMMVQGFPSNSPMADIQSGKGFHLCLCLIQMLSQHSDLTSLFLSDCGKVHSDIVTRMEGAYIYGAPINPLYGSLLFHTKNFNNTPLPPEPQVKGRANKCSCGYLYFIEDCGSPIYTMPCVICGEMIGGLNYQLVQREGHCNMSDAEAEQYLAGKVKWYQEDQEKGLWKFPCATIDGFQVYRQISQLTHTMLNLLLSLQLHFLQIAELLHAPDLAVILKSPSQDLFIGEIEEDYRDITSAIKQEGENHLWWHSLFYMLWNFMEEASSGHFTFEARTKLEKHFDILITPYFANPNDIIQQEKRRLQDINAFISVIQPERPPANCPDISLFRLTAQPTLKDLRNAFELQGLQQRYPLVGMYLEMNEELQCVPVLVPLVQISNYLLDQVNHRMPRSEAYDTKLSKMMKREKYRKLRLLYEMYEKAWNKHLCIQLGQLNPSEVKKFTISSFLPDKVPDGRGPYLISALQTLVNYQNKALTALKDFLVKKTDLEALYLMDLVPHPVQSLLPEHVISTSIDWSSCYVNNWEHDKGVDVVFNFEKLQELVRRAISRCKFLTMNKLRLVQYQFEMLSSTEDNSDLISTIRKSIRQEELLAEERYQLLQSLARYGGELQDEGKKFTLKLYEELELLLCLLKHSRTTPDMSIKDFAVILNEPRLHELVSFSFISNQQIKYVLAIFELLEVHIFDEIKTFVQQPYREKLDLRLQQDWNLLRGAEQLRIAVLRMISRLLVRGGIDPSQLMSLYVVRPDFWEETCTKEMREVYAQQLGDIPIANAVQVYELLAATIKQPKNTNLSGGRMNPPAPTSRSQREGEERMRRSCAGAG